MRRGHAACTHLDGVRRAAPSDDELSDLAYDEEY
jgi:hypothetical protein